MDWPLSREEQKKHVLRLYDKDVRAANELLHSGELALQALRDELKSVRSGSTEHKRDIAVRQNGGVLRKDVENQAEPVPSSFGRRLESSENPCVVAEPEAEFLEVDDLPTEDSCNDVERLTTPPCTPRRPCGTDRKAIESQAPASSSTPPDATETAERLQRAIVEAAAALAALLGTSSMPSLVKDIAQDARSGLQRDDGQDDSAKVSDVGSCEVRQRARSEGAEKHAAPALVKDRRRRSRGGEKLRVSFAGVEPSMSAAKDSQETGASLLVCSTVAQTQRRLSIDEPDREPGLSEPEAIDAHSLPCSGRDFEPGLLEPEAIVAPVLPCSGKAKLSRQESLTSALSPLSQPSPNRNVDVGRVGSIDRRKKPSLHDFRRSISSEKLSRNAPPAAASVSSAPAGMLDFL
eukprot:TRINITY_DN57378_c0_g1_i1.p1 TRINITY_DN57378_c0_g1~~TRINITY_DN57378_c0_g1_i1.p1  ORF type:complete len:406 (-),score=74.98 TRINITY_DN57378_c0_g1_i1:232-1449(-)